MNELEKLLESADSRIDLCVELTAVRVAELIAKQLEMTDTTQAQLAKRLNLTPGRISQVLDADSNPQLRTIARVLAGLGLVLEVDAVPLSSVLTTGKWVDSMDGAPIESVLSRDVAPSAQDVVSTQATDRTYSLAA